MYCNDQKGIIAAVTNFMHHKEGNITYIDQYVDRPNGAFFMRIESDFIGNSFDLEKFKKSFNDEIGNRFSLNCNFYLKSKKPRMAVFVSKYDHCLYDILAKQQSGELASFDQFLVQLIGVGIVGAFCVVASFIILTVVKATTGLRVDKEEEINGLDLAEHGMEAYADFRTNEG